MQNLLHDRFCGILMEKGREEMSGVKRFTNQTFIVDFETPKKVELTDLRE